jgi:beta-lactamase class A
LDGIRRRLPGSADVPTIQNPGTISRRTLLGASALQPLTACSTGTTAAGSRPAPTPPPSSAPPSPAPVVDDHPLAALEREFDARLGVHALDTGSGATIAHRAGERFAFCSAFKALAAAAVLSGHPLSHLDTVVTYSENDLMPSSVITRRHVATGMTIRELCDAAVRHSDGTAGNLLLRDLGGPRRLTAYARGLGDAVTRMDRTEPDITSAIPGDPRDTTTPRAFGTDFHRLVLGDALPSAKRAVLRDLLERNATSAGTRRIRAGVPRGWRVADKTGTGEYGTANDIAVVWPPGAAPLVVAIMSSRTAAGAAYDEALLARAAAFAVAALT